MSVRDDIQKLYIGYLGRPADAAGLDYWEKDINDGVMTMEQLRSNLVNEQPEYAEIYGDKTRTELVTKIYTNLFERAPDAAGLEYWVNGDGSTVEADQLIEAFLNAASTDDQAVVDNKLEVANHYTAELGGADTFDKAEAAAFIDAVDGTDASVTSAKADIDAAVAVSGETFTLTTSTDEFIGTAANDQFDATQATYNSADFVFDQNSDDADTFNLTTTSNITAVPTVKNIENFNVEVSKVGVFNFAADNVTGTTNFTFDRNDLLDGAIDGTGSVAVTGANDATYVAGEQINDFSVTFATNEAASTVDATAAAGDVTVAGIDEAGVTVQGAADQAVSVSGGTDSVAVVNISGDVDVTNAVDDLTLNATAESTFALNAIVETLTLEGDADITVEMGAGALDAEELVNNATGAVKLVVATPAGMDLSNVDAVTSIELVGDFTGKTIDVNSDQLITTADDQGAGVNITAAEDNATARFAALNNEATAAVTVAGLGFGSLSTTDGVAGDFDTAYVDASADKLAFTTGIDMGGDLVDSDGNGSYANGAGLIVTGTQDVDLGTVVNAASISSASTGEITLVSQGNADAEQTIVAGAGNDTVEVDDTATQTATGVDTLFVANLGTGDDTLTITRAATDSQFVTGEDNDTVTVANGVTGDVIVVTGAGDDKLTLDDSGTHAINLGAGTNTLTLTANATATDATLTLGTADVIKATGTADITDATLTGGASEVNVDTGVTLTIGADQMSSFGEFELKGTGILEVDASAETAGVTIDGSNITLGFGTAATFAVIDGQGDDVIYGTIGDDNIDLSTGGSDIYVNNDIDNNGTDTIVSFTTDTDGAGSSAGTDTLQFSDADLKGITGFTEYTGTGTSVTLSDGTAVEFVVGDSSATPSTAVASGAEAAFIFDTNNKTLSFDADGTGTEAAVDIVTLTGVTDLAVEDFGFVA
jgi:hypothetical protein